MNDKKPSREEALAHFGVKGMRWGVRNNDDIPSGSKSKAKEPKKSKTSSKISKEEYNEILKKQPKGTKAQDAAAIAKNKEKFKAKFEPNEGPAKPPPKKGWRPTKKQLAVAAVGAAYLGFVGYNLYQINQTPEGHEALSSLKTMVSKPKPGEHVDFATYNALIKGSISNTWGMKGYFTERSYDRPELVFPAGHIFHRLAGGPEHSFGQNGTYCTSSKEEMARYLASKEFGNSSHHVTWTAQNEVRVPALSTVLDTAKKALGEYSHKDVSDDEAFAWYKGASGGSWGKHGTTALFFEMLKNQGYHAIVDEMDADVYSEYPLVWFDTLSASEKSSTQLTKADIKEAKRILTEIEHRK